MASRHCISFFITLAVAAAGRPGCSQRRQPTVPRTKASTRRSVRTNLRPHLRDPRSVGSTRKAHEGRRQAKSLRQSGRQESLGELACRNDTGTLGLGQGLLYAQLPLQRGAVGLGYIVA